MKIKILFSLLAAVMLFTACSPKKYNSGSSSGDVSSQQSGEITSSEAVTPSSDEENSAEESSDEVSSDEESQPEMPTIAPLEPTVIEVIENDLSADYSEYENESKGWGQGNPVNEENRPISCDIYQEKYGEYGGVFIMPPDEKKMYLTFDEGYENGYTPVILDTLKEKNCPAVFFVTLSYVKEHSELVQRMIDEGHIVGNHSVHHLQMPSLSAQEQIEEIAGLHNYMVENFNYQMSLFRPPEGVWSTRTMYIANQLGYKTILWSYAYADWNPKKQLGVETAFPKVSKAAHNGAVYLLHAVSKDNSEMLGDLIDYWRDEGYSLEPLQ